MNSIQQYLPWLTLVMLAALAVSVLRRVALKYAEGVRNELGDYLQTNPVTTLAPLTMPPRNAADAPTVAEQKLTIWGNIQKYPLAPLVQIEVLVDQFALAQVEQRFWRAYVLMFGSQQKFLQGLNKQNGVAKRADVEEFLKKVGEMDVRVAKHEFPRWVSFLVDEGLVQADMYHVNLTPAGQDFLVWTTRRQLQDKTNE